MFEQLPLFSPSISSWAAFPARTSPAPAAALVCLVSARVCGGPIETSCARCDPALCSSRTWPPGCAVGTAPFVARSRPWAIERGPARSEHTTSARPIDESASSCWPTPTVNGEWNRKGASPTSGDGTKGSGESEKRDGGPSLTTCARWATPNARDAKGRSDRERVGSEPLPDQLVSASEPNPKLSAAWVEALMGFPAGWTSLPDGLPVAAKSSKNGSRRARSPAEKSTAELA